MKRGFNILFLLLSIAVVLASTGCSDKNAVIDKSVAVDNHNWAYLNRFRFDANIEDAAVPYNLYINLRVTGDYKYSNMFVLVTQTGPDKKSETKRYELKLANKEGEWLGDGSGNLYSFQISLRTNYKFPSKGAYAFYMEQNMRDNPLKEVSDVGIRVEKAL